MPEDAKDKADRDLPIRVINLAKSFGGRSVLDGVSLDVYPGETMVVMGPSGKKGVRNLFCAAGGVILIFLGFFQGFLRLLAVLRRKRFLTPFLRAGGGVRQRHARRC